MDLSSDKKHRIDWQHLLGDLRDVLHLLPPATAEETNTCDAFYDLKEQEKFCCENQIRKAQSQIEIRAIV